MDVLNDKKIQNQERTHPRNDESSAGVQKDNGEKTDMVWARDRKGNISSIPIIYSPEGGHSSTQGCSRRTYFRLNECEYVVSYTLGT